LRSKCKNKEIYQNPPGESKTNQVGSHDKHVSRPYTVCHFDLMKDANFIIVIKKIKFGMFPFSQGCSGQNPFDVLLKVTANDVISVSPTFNPKRTHFRKVDSANVGHPTLASLAEQI